MMRGFPAAVRAGAAIGFGADDAVPVPTWSKTACGTEATLATRAGLAGWLPAVDFEPDPTATTAAMPIAITTATTIQSPRPERSDRAMRAAVARGLGLFLGRFLV